MESHYSGQQIVGYEGERKTILVVDDKWENRAVIINLLQPIGFNAIEACDGQEGLTKALEIKPNLIITDLFMPVINGYQFIERVRESATLKMIPTIVSSASVSNVERQNSLDAGGDDFLVKPVSVDDLFEILRKHLDLNWIYQSTVLPDESLRSTIRAEAADISVAIALPSCEQLTQLLHLAQQGRLKKMSKIAKALEEEAPEYQPLVKHLLELSQGFQVVELEIFIQKLLEQKTCA